MKISVVIPAYNEAGVLENCLASLAAQTYPAHEIIVIDNNSRDATAEIARSLGATVIAETQQGIWAASIAGYDAARGDIIARCDADSILPPQWLEMIAAHFTDPELIALTGPGRFYGAPKLACWAADRLYMDTYFTTVGWALGNPPLFGSNFAMRRSAWRAASNAIHNREDIHDDIDLSYHLPSGRVIYDKNLSAQISIRPLTNASTLPDRYAKGFRSIFIHWPEHAPWRRAIGHNRK